MSLVRGRRIGLIVGFIVCAVAVICLVLFACWRGGLFLPRWVEWNNAEEAVDLDGDGDFEAISLEDRQLAIYDDGQLACTSTDGWFISDVFVGDLDSDGVQEIVCMTWKRGSYGIAKPFWVERDSPDFSQHVFIFQYVDGQLEQRWLSSDIGIQVERASMDKYARLHLHTHDDQDYLCEWEGWGISYVDEDNPSMREADYDEVSFLAVGDNIIHTSILDEACDPATGSYDFTPVYSGVSDWISSYDIAAINQETPLVDDPALYSGDFPDFGTPTAAGDALADSGFDVIEAATNHVGDQGVIGIDDTMTFWRDEHPDVSLLGLNATPEDRDTVTYRDEGSIRFALFDYTFGLNSTSTLDEQDAWRVDTLDDLEGLKSGLATAKGEADVSICFLHCGEEYSDAPSTDEEEMCAQLIDAGADVIICTHPHVVQPTRYVTTAQGNTGLVCYSLGNFVANQPYPSTVLGGAVSLVFEKPKGDDAGETRVATCAVIPTVCQASGGTTRVCLLKDYTQEMAAAQYQNSIEPGSVTLEGLRKQWVALTSAGV